MLKVAVLGANGFIGSRIVEMFHLQSLADVRPIVRSVSSFARLSRFDLDFRIGNALDRSSLRAAFEGCDMVIHAVAGDHKTILRSVDQTYRAAQEVTVRRIVYLSSASVHGQAPEPGTNESSSLSDRQPLAYNNAKVRAERKLMRLREKGTVEAVILRPGIVFGPRSSWIVGFADDLLTKNAFMVNDGKGICNSIYIDNLVHAISLAMTASSVDGEAFLIGDEEQIKWSDFYRPIVEAFGLEFSQILIVRLRDIDPRQQRRLGPVLDSKLVKAIVGLLPDRLKWSLKSGRIAWQDFQTRSPWRMPADNRPFVSLETALLHHCQYKLPFEKAKRMLGYKPIISFKEASRRTIAWLSFAGYPVVDLSDLSKRKTQDVQQSGI
jgi:nucleoside-diphosphate-sugar epimerase